MMGNWQNALRHLLYSQIVSKYLTAMVWRNFFKYCVKFLIKVLWQPEWLI